MKSLLLYFLKVNLMLSLLFAASSAALASPVTVSVSATDGSSVGSISFEDNPFGLLITPKLSNLPEGPHGFHIHEHPDCGDHAMNAGGHWDPTKTNAHLGPYNKGHLGDLPLLFVDKKGEANTPVIAPRLTTKDLAGHAIMIHAQGDNYSDTPPLGGGGDRIACGILNLK